MRYLLQKSPFCEENKIEIDAEICGSLSELNYIRSLQKKHVSRKIVATLLLHNAAAGA